MLLRSGLPRTEAEEEKDMDDQIAGLIADIDAQIDKAQEEGRTIQDIQLSDALDAALVSEIVLNDGLPTYKGILVRPAPGGWNYIISYGELLEPVRWASANQG